MGGRKSGLLGRIIYGLNILAAFLLLLAYLVPYVPPARFPSISLIGLAVIEDHRISGCDHINHISA